MTKTTINEIKQKLDELTTNFNQLLQTLEETGLKKRIDFTELEIIDENEEIEEDENEGDEEEIIDDEENIIN